MAKLRQLTAQMFSKSKGNGVDPLEIIEQGYGADALRTYLMFAAPLDIWAKWDPQGRAGDTSFPLAVVEPGAGVSGGTRKALTRRCQRQQLKRAVHPMIKKMTEDIEENRYNTAIAAAMGT